MRLRSTLALALAACAAPLAATPAAAQQTITLGQTVRGRLDSSKPTLDDGSHYDIWNYRGRAGERISITLKSTDFDAYLAFGKMQGGECSAECETDDDGGGGTDSRVTVTLDETGVYQIRANSLSEGETGSYTLQVSAAEPEAPVRSSGTIGVGQTQRGRLESTDPRADDDSFYDLWTVRASAGQRLTITLRSSDFDAFLGWGRMDGGEWEEMESDDDGAGGTNARLEVTVGSGGVYTIRANTLSAGETGAYELEVREGGSGGGDSDDSDDSDDEEAPVDLGRLRPIRAGDPVNGELSTGDPKLPDDSYYDAYVYEGRQGERVTVTLESGAFDTFLSFGRLQGTRFEPIESNDDAGEGTDSELTVTLPASGRYVIRANSLGGDATGAYTLRVTSSR